MVVSSTSPEMSGEYDAESRTAHAAECKSHNRKPVSRFLVLDHKFADDRVLKDDQTICHHRPNDEPFGEGSEVCGDDEEGDQFRKITECKPTEGTVRYLDLGDYYIKPFGNSDVLEELTNLGKEGLNDEHQ